MEALIVIPVLVANVALPLLTAAARDNLDRLRYALAGLAEGAVIAGVLVALVTFRAAEPLMSGIWGGLNSAQQEMCCGSRCSLCSSSLCTRSGRWA